jgi:mono/diheme cytochrome c family protein
MKQAKYNFPKLFVLAFFAIGATGFIFDKFILSSSASKSEVEVPNLSALAQAGEDAFALNCASCHGKNGVGSKVGPPLVHDTYNPGHHPDESFYAAVKNGVRQHHWPYGNMPAQPQVSQDDLRAIVQYVREVQVANGIRYRRHTM